MNAADATTALNAAASQLLAAGRADADASPPAMRLKCLLAVDHLHAAGVHPTHREPAAAGPPEQLIRSAMTELASLPPHVFASPDILHAAIAARHALARIEDA